MKLEEAIRLGYEIIIWGTGKCFEDNIDRIKKYIAVSTITDSEASYEDKYICGFNYKKLDAFAEQVFVIVMVKNVWMVDEIEKKLKCMHLPYCLAEEAIGYCTIMEESIIVEKHWNELSEEISWDDSKWDNVMKKYVGIHVPATTCNLACPYCYIRQNKEFYSPPVLYRHPKYIRLCLSQKRLGGQALIGLCGAGETMLADKFIDICVELLKEGHFLHIVTNGTTTDKIEELIKRSGKYVGHVFFKFSFHYLELKRQNKLEVFAKSVNMVSKAGASFTVELTTDDNLLDEIEDVKSFSLEKFGALPHITIARDDTKKDIPIYTKLSHEKYYEIWSQFNSSLFDVKWNYFGKFIYNCYSGMSSIYIDLLSGNVMRCMGQPAVVNLYNLKEQMKEYEIIKDKCVFPYCYNNHAYLTLGISPDVQTYSYAEVRDRVRVDGSHWVKEEMYHFMNQKLYDTNHYAVKEE